MRTRAMSKLLVRSGPPDADGCVLSVTPASAGWRYVGFEGYRLSEGARLARRLPDRESCVVVLCGRVDLAAEGQEWRDQGGRDSVFDGPPTALYVPPRAGWSAEAATSAELARCRAPPVAAPH